MKNYLFILIVSLIPCICAAQTIDFSATVDFEYRGETLSEVMDDIYQKYGIGFSYSRHVIPLDQKLYTEIHQENLKDALDALFAQTQVVYGFIGHQLVLSVDENKIPVTPDLALMLDDAGNDDLLASTDLGHQRFMAERPNYSIPRIAYHRNMGVAASFDQPINLTSNFSDQEWDYAFAEAERRSSGFSAQMTVFPPLRLATDNADDTPLNLSLNILWGLNESINGLEMGGIGNSIWGDVEGLQLAGLFNTVGGDVRGVQWAGIANYIEEGHWGLSASGIVNYAGKLESGFQAAGIVNLVHDESTGFQAAGIANLAVWGGDIFQASGITNITADRVLGQISGIANVAEDVKAVQISGISNIAEDVDGAQISGIANVAKDIDGAQISGIINIARNVDGAQIGLINVADTVDGASIGLLSFIINGYHSLELAGEDVVYGNIYIRLGIRKFYNILHIGGGSRLDNPTWTLGYGIGSSVWLGKRNYLQLEVISKHINEEENWTDELNLLNQAKINFDIGLGRHFSLAFGPSFNVAVSRLYDADRDRYGTSINHYTTFNKTYYDHDKPVNVTGWFGFQAGLRLKLSG
jgi:hypothetical protein